MHRASESIKYQLISNAQNMLSVQCVEYSFVYKETCLSHVVQGEILCVREHRKEINGKENNVRLYKYYTVKGITQIRSFIVIPLCRSSVLQKGSH